MIRPRPSARGALVAAAATLLVVAGLALLLLQRAPRTLHEAESEFGTVRVEERWNGVRVLRIGAGRAVQTAMDPRRPLVLQSPYTRVAMVGLALADSAAALLFVGVGGGAMPTYVRHVRPHAMLDAVDIDPVVIAAAVRWFGLQPDERLRVHADDGRAFIARAPAGTWDVIFLDAYSDADVPRALTTLEFLESVRSRLRPRGVVVSNLWTGNADYDAWLATYVAAFPHVVEIRVPQRAQNIVVASAARPLARDSVFAAIRALAAATDLRFDLEALVAEGWSGAPAGRAAPVLRDGMGARVGGARPFAAHWVRHETALTQSNRGSPP